MKPERQTEHFRGRVIRVTTDEVTLPNGHRTTLEIVHHPGGAAAVALDAEQRVCLLRQYRYVAEGWVWELPAGKLEPAEAPLATAQRELVEEAGVSARHWRSLGVCLSSPGVFTERRASVPRDGNHARCPGPRACRGHRNSLGAARAGLQLGPRWDNNRRQDGPRPAARPRLRGRRRTAPTAAGIP